VTTFSPVSRFRPSISRVGSAAILAVLALTFAVSAAPAAAVTRTPYNTNLVKNPGFEAGQATGGYRWIAVPNWQTYGNMTVVKYGAPGGFPTLAEGARISGGKKFFTMGTPSGGSTTCSQVALQVIPIRRRAAAIDSGHVRVSFRLYMGTYDSQPDTAVALLRSNVGDHIGHNVTKTDGSMVLQGITLVLPPGVRTLTVLLYSRNTQGYCDAYFDRVSVVLTRF
jgi:hypothetical protein